MNTVVKFYNEEFNKPVIYSDIKEHLPTLKRYAEQCSHITEMGMRNIVSTWAFMMGKPKKLISYDVEDPPSLRLEAAYTGAREIGIDFKFIKQDVLEADIENTDLLFIDTWHITDQLKKELEIHSEKVSKFIIMHDTTTFGINGEDSNHQPTLKGQGLIPAIHIFLESNTKWKVKEVFTNNNGLTILERNR
jgi:hypothetical protein